MCMSQVYTGKFNIPLFLVKQMYSTTLCLLVHSCIFELAKPVKMICSMVGESSETKSQQSVVSITSNYIQQTRAAVLVAKNEQLSSTTCVLETNHALGKTLISLFMLFHISLRAKVYVCIKMHLFKRLKVYTEKLFLIKFCHTVLIPIVFLMDCCLLYAQTQRKVPGTHA